MEQDVVILAVPNVGTYPGSLVAAIESCVRAASGGRVLAHRRHARVVGFDRYFIDIARS